MLATIQLYIVGEIIRAPEAEKIISSLTNEKKILPAPLLKATSSWRLIPINFRTMKILFFAQPTDFMLENAEYQTKNETKQDPCYRQDTTDFSAHSKFA